MTTNANAALPSPNLMLGEQAAVLRRHLEQCSQARSRWFGAAAWGERVHTLLAPRMVSTVAVLLLAMVVVTAWL